MRQRLTNGIPTKGFDMNITEELYDEALMVVSWIKKEKPKTMSEEDWQRIVKRNKAHISTLLNAYEFDGYNKKPLLGALND
jgi:hypothetical protein